MPCWYCCSMQWVLPGMLRVTQCSGAFVPVPPPPARRLAACGGSQMGTQYVHPGVVCAYAFRNVLPFSGAARVGLGGSIEGEE